MCLLYRLISSVVISNKYSSCQMSQTTGNFGDSLLLWVPEPTATGCSYALMFDLWSKWSLKDKLLYGE